MGKYSPHILRRMAPAFTANGPIQDLPPRAQRLTSPIVPRQDPAHELIKQPTPERFSVCYDHTCASVATLSVNAAEWRLATEPLSGEINNAADERAAIAQAIAILEEITGAQLGTSADRGGNLAGLGKPKQLDCIDESTNSSTYLRMLEQAGLLRHHTVMDRSTRFGLFAGMPHTTAVIMQNDTGVRYAVDSWFFDNGEPPYIVELDAWKSGRDPY